MEGNSRWGLVSSVIDSKAFESVTDYHQAPPVGRLPIRNEEVDSSILFSSTKQTA